ncbi:MAG: PBP1A family penicillin-binding protein [Pseudomonadota bacterium]
MPASAKPRAKSTARRRTSSTRRTQGRRGSLWARYKRFRQRHPFLVGTARAGLIASLVGFVLLAGAVLVFISRVPDPLLATLDDRPPNVTVLAADGSVLAERGLRRGHIRVDVLPDHLIKAVLATEDRRFYDHWGVDIGGLIRASYRNFRAGTVVQGGSTITQQLAKNLFLKPERTVTRKLEELVYTVWLEKRFSKNEILELYLNRVYLGGGTYGVEAAARRYFGRSARDVTLAQSAVLAGLLKAPSRYAPTRSIQAASARAQVVLDNMIDAGFITAAEAKKAGQQPLRVQAKGDATGYPYAVDWVAAMLPEYVGKHDDALVVQTTIDAKLQRLSQERLRKLLDGKGRKLRAGEGAVVVLDPNSGAVRALVGGRSYKHSPYDRALHARRQPGSAFKPFVYLAALEAGYRPSSVALDGPVNISGWRPSNYTKTYKGRVSLRYALAHSINTVAVKLTANVGPARVAQTAQRLGVGSKLNAQPSLALGTSEVTLVELTGAYAPFANGGTRVLPHVITHIRTEDGETLYTRQRASAGRVVAQPHVAAMNDMMSAVVRSGTGRRAAIPRHPAGGKTGTTQNSRDAWFVGYTAHYVGGIWIGNDDNTPMKKVTGGSLPAELWREIMLAAHKGKRPAALPSPRGPGAPWHGGGGVASRFPFFGGDDTKRSARARPLFQRVIGFFGGG